MKKLLGLTTAVVMMFGLLGAASVAHAADQYLTFNTYALHFKKADERNNVTPGIGWEYSPSGKIGFHVGTVKDSFNYQAKYIGLNYATPRYAVLGGRVRFILGVTALHKQYSPNSEPTTKIVPLPAVEFQMTDRFVINVSGSPEIDFQDHHNNAVMFFQGKWNVF
jgi:hypothetical protein